MSWIEPAATRRVYNPNDPTYVAPTGDYFLHTIRGFDDRQVAAWRAKPTTFFQQRFGLDSRRCTSNNVSITGTFMFDPRNNYRAHTISGMLIAGRGPKLEAAVRPSLVVVIDMLLQDAPEVALTQDQKPVQRLPTRRPGVRSRPSRFASRSVDLPRTPE